MDENSKVEAVALSTCGVDTIRPVYVIEREGLPVAWANNADVARTISAALASPKPAPFCSTCGKDVTEVLCPHCAKSWADNSPAPDVAELVDMRQAILTDSYWRQRLNADPNVLGREIRVNGVPRKIVGVLPHDFRFLSSEVRIFLPFTSELEQRTPLQRHSGGGGTQ